MERVPITIRVYISAFIYITLLLGCQTQPLAEEQKVQIQKIAKGDDPAKILGKRSDRQKDKKPAVMSDDLLDALKKVHTNPGDIPRLKVVVEGEKLNLPLKHTHAKVNIVGYVAEVEVTQSYENPFEYPIEAVYIFPLPENSAVNDMKMVIGDRVIEASIKKREEARRTYERAVREGHTAALLEQERPNIFTQSVANIAPGTAIDVKIRYVQNLTYDAGEYEFVFPMVVGPRFIPGDPAGSKKGTGWAEDTGEVPDASRITPAIVGGGLRSGHDISIELEAEVGFPITSYHVPTHRVVHTPTGDGSLNLQLAKNDSIPNRDFVLKFGVGGAKPQATFLTHRSGGDGYFSLLIQPPKLDMEQYVGKREIIFVVDVSGSMSGVPLAMCKHAMEEAILGLRPMDTFNVITFESRTGKAFEHPRPASDVNIDSALDFVSGMRAGGGTMMGLGVQAAFAREVEQGRHRYVFFMTDGYIGNEAAIMSMTREFVSKLDARGNRARVFSMGVGSSVNRHLLDGIADAGDGLAVYATNREDPADSIDKIYRYIDHPIIEDIEIDWGDVKVSDVYPEDPGDLFASRPVIVQGKFDNKHGASTISIRGSVDGHDVHVPIDIEFQRGESREVLASLWARSKVDWLEKSLIYEGHSPGVVDQITTLGLSHRLVTPYTSFVAVDRSGKVKGKLRTIAQPVETPEGVNPHMAGGKIITRKPSGRRYKGEEGQMGKRDAALGAIQGFGYGGLGFVGTGHGGGGGSGSGYGRGAGAASSAPKIRMGKAVVKGSLSKEVIRRIIRRHMNEVKFCYHRELAKDPSLSGKVVVKIIISSTGAVQSVVVESSTVNNEKVENCIVRAIKRWTFPQPAGGGIVIISMPFNFSPNDA